MKNEEQYYGRFILQIMIVLAVFAVIIMSVGTTVSFVRWYSQDSSRMHNTTLRSPDMTLIIYRLQGDRVIAHLIPNQNRGQSVVAHAYVTKFGYDWYRISLMKTDGNGLISPIVWTKSPDCTWTISTEIGRAHPHKLELASVQAGLSALAGGNTNSFPVVWNALVSK